MSFVRLSRLLRTVTFRLALLQAGLFAVSAAVLYAVVYLGLAAYAREQLRSAIAAEAAALADERTTDGLSEIIRTIDLRARERASRGFTYVLVAADGHRLAGSLDPSLARLGWHDLPASLDPANSADDERHGAEAFGQSLPSGETLVVGRDLRDVDDLKERLAQSFGVAAALTLLLAILSGVLTSAGALRRVEGMNAITRRIMDGDLDRRLPVRGTGDEFDRLALNTNAMLERIQSLMEGLRQVSNDIAHDLRTPLAHLRQRLETAREGPRRLETYEDAVEAASADVDKILRIFASLLRIAQIEAGTRRAAFAELDVSAILAEIAEVYAPVAEDAGQTLISDIEPDVRTRGDRDLFTQMLANLVENAIRHAGSGARISLTLARRGAVFVARIADTGPGIPEDARERVFGRFVRLDGSRPGDGHGLGLAMVKAAADLHGIRIALSDADPGLAVTLTGTAGAASDADGNGAFPVEEGLASPKERSNAQGPR